jgi:threonine/homoserine/homoserine lactone efflux protein
MRSLIFIISAYFTGFLAAIPSGPVQIEVVRRSINSHLRSSLMVVLGALIADIVYGVIAFFGIAPYLKDEKVIAVFWLAGGSILVMFSIIIIRHSTGKNPQTYNPRFLKKKRWALLGGLSLSATNPGMILWWLLGAKLFTDMKIIDSFTPDIAVSFLAAGGTGLASYLVLLSLILFWAKKFIPDNRLRLINLMFGIILLCVSAYFIISSVVHLLK